jgi:uncharacterized protein YbjQ (UPF0145 family)
MADGKWMCAHVGCEQVGQPTDDRACRICGSKTTRFDEYWALELTRPAPSSQPPTPPLSPVLVVTMNEVPGFRILAVHGEVFGLIVRVRNAFSQAGAGLRSLVGGEVGGYTKLLTASRYEALERLRDAAREVGANAVVAMRFDCNEIGDIMSEIAAYGTAVTVAEEDND